MTLYTHPGNFRAFKILIAAEYNEVDIDIPDFKPDKVIHVLIKRCYVLLDYQKLTGECMLSTVFFQIPDFKQLSPLGRTPVLKTPQGVIFESNAIARYIARFRRDSELFGSSFFDSASVDSWIEFCVHEVELPATVWFYPVIGYMPYVEAAVTKAKGDLLNSLKVLEDHLASRTYLVGEKITLADIVVVSALVYPMKLVLAPHYLKSLPCVVRWFTTCVNQPQFQAVVGNIELAKEELKPSGVPVAAAADGKKEKKQKKQQQPVEKKQKQQQAAKPKEKEPAPQKEPPEKKELHPLAVLDKENPSPFIADVWKKLYSNSEDYNDTMAKFWDMFDAEGWSLWIARYNYNSENTRLFMTSNLVGGFIQRSDAMRKWAFGKSSWLVEVNYSRT